MSTEPNASNGHIVMTAPAATNGHTIRRPTLSELAAKATEASEGLYDQLCSVTDVTDELERAIEQLEAAEKELGRRVRLKRARDARYRQRKRGALAVG